MQDNMISPSPLLRVSALKRTQALDQRGRMRAGEKRKQKESLFAQPDAIKNSMRVVRCSGIFILLLPVERK